ncbi:hypothetical protein EDC56_2826 [Sinobacterium caligoides]|uniref:Uncharacterized protein n=1 Tax=Sinobacterium caligoides TaxID=933926 RepID=A0A3N2DKH9_9GAMM|nr:hypothetical protein [Sinobacterium caligoides]ROS00189.1 hypothetical protein EDC56_2826 [Sinobacterium caligoides]
MIVPEKIDIAIGVPTGFVYLGEELDSFSKYQQTYFLLKYSGLLIISKEKERRFHKGKYSKSQFCLPYSAISWLINSINNFYTSPSEGGQHAGKIDMEAIIDGEHLLLNRVVSIDGTGYSGFSLNNLSRKVYGASENSRMRQEVSFTGEFLQRSNFIGLLSRL